MKTSRPSSLLTKPYPAGWTVMRPSANGWLTLRVARAAASVPTAGAGGRRLGAGPAHGRRGAAGAGGVTTGGGASTGGAATAGGGWLARALPRGPGTRAGAAGAASAGAAEARARRSPDRPLGARAKAPPTRTRTTPSSTSAIMMERRRA